MPIIAGNSIDGTPNLGVKILAESRRSQYWGIEFERHAEEGVQEYWMVNPDKKKI